LIFKVYVTRRMYLFSLYVCILYFMLSFICDFVAIIFTYFNLKFCSKFVLLYIQYAVSSVTRSRLTYFCVPLAELRYIDILKYYES